MGKYFRDKTIALLGAALLGYYLGLSLFRGIIWDGLLKILPPINDRHLPQMYLGLMGAVIAVLLVYLIFTLFIEKKEFKKFPKTYIVLVTLLIMLPLFIAGIFRVHAVSLVTKAEGTIPTEISIRSSTPDNSLMFKTSSSSAGGVSKNLIVKEPYLEEIGKELRELELKETVNWNEQKFPAPLFTMWLEYRVEGKWYSKILSYDQGLFEEHVAGRRIAYYENEDLKELLEKLIATVDNLYNYTRARVLNSETVNQRTPEDFLEKGALEKIIQAVNPENKIKPQGEAVEKIKAYLEKDVPLGDTRIYAIELLAGDIGKSSSRNFMVYDNNSKILMFAGNYYGVDLTTIIEEHTNS